MTSIIPVQLIAHVTFVIEAPVDSANVVTFDNFIYITVYRLPSGSGSSDMMYVLSVQMIFEGANKLLE